MQTESRRMVQALADLLGFALLQLKDVHDAPNEPAFAIVRDLAMETVSEIRERLAYAILAESGEATSMADFSDPAWTHQERTATFKDHNGVWYTVDMDRENDAGDPRPTLTIHG